MKKLIAAAAVVLSTTAVAQPDKDVWACQYFASAESPFKDGKWETSGHREDPPFVLVSDGTGLLTNESVSNSIKAPAANIRCTRGYTSSVSCSDGRAGFLFFNPRTGHGGVSWLDIASMIEIKGFECTKG